MNELWVDYVNSCWSGQQIEAGKPDGTVFKVKDFDNFMVDMYVKFYMTTYQEIKGTTTTTTK